MQIELLKLNGNTSGITNSTTGKNPLKNFQIKYLKNIELHERLQQLVVNERKMTHQILLHIMEVDRRKLYLAKAYPSLWAYLTQGIGYSAPQAQRRIDAARLMVQVPELGQKIESGSVNFSQVSLLQKTLREMKRSTQTSLPAEQKQKLVEKLENQPPRETQRILAETFQIPLENIETKKIQRDGSVRVEITFSKAEMETLEWAQGLLAHGLQRSEKDFGFKSLFLYCAKKVLKTKTGLQV